MSVGPKIPPVIDGELDGAYYGNDVRRLFRAIQALVQANVISASISVPPGAPNNGDTYIVGAAPSGAWVGQANNIAYWTTADPNNPGGIWEFYVPSAGWLAYNQFSSTLFYYTGTAWQSISLSQGAVAGAHFSTAIGPTFGAVSSLGTNFTQGGLGATTNTFLAPTATEPASNSCVETQLISHGYNSFYDQLQLITPGTLIDCQFRFKPVSATASWVWAGITDANMTPPTPGTTFSSDNPNVNFIGFRFSPAAGDTHWKAYASQSNVAFTVVDTGIVPDTANSHLFEIKQNAPGIFLFLIDGVQVASINTNLPANSTLMAIAVMQVQGATQSGNVGVIVSNFAWTSK